MEYFIKPFSLFSGPKTHTYYIIISLFPMQAMAIIEAQVAHIQSVRLLISVRAYQPANSIFLSQQTSTSRTYQSINQPANKPNIFSSWVKSNSSQYMYVTILQTSKWNFYERKKNGNRPEFLKGTGNFTRNTYGTREKNCRSEKGHLNEDQKQIISLIKK